MAQFETVTWTGAAEVTSTKLQQMSNNDEWLKENAITGDIVYIKNHLGQTGSGRTEGIEKIQRTMALNFAVDSQVPVRYVDVGIRYPKPFSAPPIVLVTPIFGPGLHVFCRILNGTRADITTIRINYGDAPSTAHIKGELNVLAIGY